MTRKNKILFILSVLVILAPMVFGLVVWERLLPAFTTMKGFMLFTIIFLPLLFLLLHILCVGFALLDYKKKEQSEKIVTLSLCIFPAITFFALSAMYLMIVRGDFEPYSLAYLLIGGTFILIGNYMPKARRNRMFGVKTVWALASDEIWARTQRFAGKISVIAGALLLLCILLPQSPALLIAAILSSALIAAIIPTVYSYVIYKDAVKAGTLAPEAAKRKKSEKIALGVSIPLIAVILAACAVISFTGSISFTLGEDALTVDSTYWSETQIAYDDIAVAELIEDEGASRVSGFGSPILSMGLFKSDKIGTHTRFTYTKAKKHILLTLTDGGKIVLGTESAEGTMELYEKILEKIS